MIEERVGPWYHSRVGTRGSVLILAIFFLFLVQLLALAFGRLVPVELLSAGKTRMDVGASLAVEAGLQYSLAWIENELDKGREPTSVARPTVKLSSKNLTRQMDGWVWTVLIEPDARTAPLGTDNQRVYKLTAEASTDGKTVLARMRSTAVQESFAQYARFVDTWPDQVWAEAGPSHVEGRFHTNDVMHILIYPGFYERKGDKAAFWGKVTAAGHASTEDGVEYYPQPRGDVAPYEGSKKQQALHYGRLFGGRSRLQTGVDKIPMPGDDAINALRTTAWGKLNPPANNGKLFLNPNQANPTSLAGVYVAGDVAELRLSDDNGVCTQNCTLASGQNYKIVEARERPWVTPKGKVISKGDTALIGPGGVESEHQGLPNGVFFVNGTVAKIAGINRGPHTIAAKDDLVLAPLGQLLRSNAGGVHSLGLVCHNFKIPAFDRHNQDVVLEAALICSSPTGKGGILVDQWNDTTLGVSKLIVRGSLVQDYNWPWSLMDTNNPQQSTPIAGYQSELHYDPNLPHHTPPCFPCTNKLTLQQAVYQNVK